MNIHKLRRIGLGIHMSCVVSTLVVLWLNAVTLLAQPTVNETLTKQAFDLYNTNKLVEAIAKAEECIQSFSKDAAAAQKELDADLKRQNKTLPETIKPKTIEERDEVMSRGPLNDVATCWFIEAESYRKQSGVKKVGKDYRVDNRQALTNACEAYSEVLKFSLGRCWQPNTNTPVVFGFFWSPAAKAQQWLDDLEPVRSRLSTTRREK